MRAYTVGAVLVLLLLLGAMVNEPGVRPPTILLFEPLPVEASPSPQVTLEVG